MILLCIISVKVSLHLTDIYNLNITDICLAVLGKKEKRIPLSIYLFGILRRFQHCAGHITTGSWKSRGNQYMQLVKVLYCKLPTNDKQLPTFPIEVSPGSEP